MHAYDATTGATDTPTADRAGGEGDVAHDPHRIVVHGLVKTFGSVRAVDDLSFTVEPGLVTGFLGPNGAGKTTTLRCVLGLITPTRGTATIGGRRYADLDRPLQTVGAALEASSFHPGRSARDHLRVLCAMASIPDRRADEVLDVTGMTEYARRRVGGFSTGMRQRLGLAAALLGDPAVLILDEPAAGLDPAGMNWLRQLLRFLAADRGKTVLVSSHLLAEMEHTADRLVVIARGRLIREGALADFIGAGVITDVTVRSPDAGRLRELLTGAGMRVEGTDGALLVRRADPAAVGHVAFANRVELHELSATRGDLEHVFLELTGTPEEGDVR